MDRIYKDFVCGSCLSLTVHPRNNTLAVTIVLRLFLRTAVPFELICEYELTYPVLFFMLSFRPLRARHD